MPYRLARLESVGPAIPSVTVATIAKPLEHCLAEFGCNEKLVPQGREIDRRYHGIAVACFIEGGGDGPKETARLDLEAGGSQPPDGPEWLHEIKFDSYRMYARLEGGAVRLVTRTGLDWTSTYPAIASLPARQAYLD